VHGQHGGVGECLATVVADMVVLRLPVDHLGAGGGVHLHTVLEYAPSPFSTLEWISANVIWCNKYEYGEEEEKDGKFEIQRRMKDSGKINN
jgi:hypothetical protein